MNAISSNGRAVGWRTNSNSPTFSQVADWNGTGLPTIWSHRGLDGTTSCEEYAVNADGTVIFGSADGNVYALK